MGFIPFTRTTFFFAKGRLWVEQQLWAKRMAHASHDPQKSARPVAKGLVPLYVSLTSSPAEELQSFFGLTGRMGWHRAHEGMALEFHVVSQTRIRVVFGNLNSPRRAFRRRNEGGCLLAQRKWLLPFSLTRDAHQELKAAAQQHCQCRLKHILIANGRQLDLTATLSEAGLREGDSCSLANWLPP